MEALAELYSKLSNELHKDNLIHKDEFMWALFKANRDNLFADRVGAESARGCGRGPCAPAGRWWVAVPWGMQHGRTLLMFEFM